jgi:CheY-like chemotaxis protein
MNTHSAITRSRRIIGKNTFHLADLDKRGRVTSSWAAFKAWPGLATIPIIAVSSFAMKGDEKKTRASGCDD